MKTKKYKWNKFLFYDYSGIVSQCEKMALQGWKLKKITPFFYEYEKIEPQPLKYTVTYFSEASDFNADVPQSQQTFQDYCENAGWKLATENAQMLIFYSEEKEPIPIETDESIKLEIIHRAMKKNFIPSQILLLVIAVLQLIMQFYDITNRPISFFSDATRLYVILLWGLVLISVLMSLLGYVFWCRKSKKSILLGGVCVEKRSSSQSSAIVLALTGIILILWAYSLYLKGFNWVKIGIVAILIPSGMYIIIRSIREGLKKKKVSRKVNLTITIIACVALSFLSITVITLVAISGIISGNISSNEALIYTMEHPDGTTWDWKVYHDDIPLRVEDLMEVDYNYYSYENQEQDSIFLNWIKAHQNSFPDDADIPELRYEIVDVKIPTLYKMVENEFKDGDVYSEEMGNHFIQTDDASWKANKVYQFYYQDEPANEYIICWDKKIVKIWLSWAPTPEQIKIAAEKLAE